MIRWISHGIRWIYVDLAELQGRGSAKPKELRRLARAPARAVQQRDAVRRPTDTTVGRPGPSELAGRTLEGRRSQHDIF